MITRGIQYVHDNLLLVVETVGLLGAAWAFRKRIYAGWDWLFHQYNRPARIEEMVGKINYALFNGGNEGICNQIARLSACHAAQFQAAPYPAFECNSAGQNTRVNEAYLQLVEFLDAADIGGTRWQQVTYGELREAYRAEFVRCASAREDFIGVVDFQNPMTGEHRGRWRVYAPCAQIGADCLFVGRFIAALDPAAQTIAAAHGWSLRKS